MIINLSKYKEHGYGKAVLIVIKKLFLSLNQPVLINFFGVSRSSNKYKNYPKYIIDPLSRMDKCTSCNICVDICPTSVIEIQEKQDGFSGPITKSPATFRIDLSACVQCGYCIEDCPEGALSQDGEYEYSELKASYTDIKSIAALNLPKV